MVMRQPEPEPPPEPPPILGRDTFQKALCSAEIELVNLRPFIDGAMYVRPLTGKELDKYREECMLLRQQGGDTASLRNVMARFCVRCICDADGKQILKDTDADWLGEKPAGALGKLFDAGQRLSGLSDEEVKELAKNSSDGQTDDSGSDSVLPSEATDVATPTT